MLQKIERGRGDHNREEERMRADTGRFIHLIIGR